MKTHVVLVAGIAVSILLSTAAQASSDTVSSLQKQVDKAHADLDKAKGKAELMMTSSDKSEWREAEKKFENMVANGKDLKKISAQEELLQDLETRVIKPSESMEGPRSTRVNLDLARQELVQAQAKLNQAKTALSAVKQKNNDDSSQFTQPENRTQNGSNFSIRSQRDSENHPPLPASP